MNICASVFNNQSALMSGVWSVCYILYFELWVRRKMNILHLHWVHSGIAHYDLCTSPMQDNASLGTRVPQKPRSSILWYHTCWQMTNWLRPPSQLPLLVGRDGNKQLGLGKVSIHLCLGGTGLRDPCIPQNPPPTNPVLPALGTLISKLPPLPLCQTSTQGQESLGTDWVLWPDTGQACYTNN